MTVHRLHFPYIKSGAHFRPIIPIQVRYNNILIEYVALIDSGADFNLFPGEIADTLGIKLDYLRSESIGGISGSAKGYPYTLELGIGDTFYRTTVIFSYDIALRSFGILGQVGFFDKFDIEFSQRKKNVQLKG